MVAASPLTQRHRAQQLLIRSDLQTKMRQVWPVLDGSRLDASYDQFASRTATLVRQARLTSAGVAGTYVRQMRAARGIKGKAVLELAASLDADQFEAVLHSQSVAAIKAASGRGVLLDEAMRIGLALSSGAMVRLALDGGRQTVVDSVRADRAGRGWARVLGGGGCDFCQEQAGRGFVFKSEETANYEAHSNCACSVEPSFA